MTSASKSPPDTSAARKSALSCAECRRSKLRCDRVFPCQSCIRRGCAGICPEGTLTATKGNKVIMAHAEKLAEEVKVLTARIRELEGALSGQANGESHPLLQTRDSQREEIDALYEKGLHEVSEAIGSLAIGQDGQAKYHGETAGSEYFQSLLPPTEEEAAFTNEHHNLDLPYELVDLVNSFPFGMKDCSYTKIIFAPYIPTQERAMYLAELYYKNTAWMYDPIIQQDFLMNILTPIYFVPGFTHLNTIHAHKLAVFFLMMGDGVLYDPSPDAKLLAEQYHALAQAAISIEPLLLEVTSATVQALFMMVRFIYNSDRKSNEARWVLNGLCARLAQSIGLHRDSSGWNLDPEEQQRRRRMFWELYTYDAWTSIVNGRPPSLMIQHTDCRFPDDVDPVLKGSGEKELSWHAWKLRYSASCLSISIQHIFTTRVPSYKALLDLDKKIRKFPVAPHLQSPIEASEAGRAWSADRLHAMQQYCVVCERESNLLYIHRSYFAQAIQAQSRNPLQHQYAPSVLATYRSACRLISSLRGLYISHPDIAAQTWFFWSGIFSSCVGILRLPTSTVLISPIRLSLVLSLSKARGARLPMMP
ncbi:fungal-specific transcription factor domain-containing protein [Mucidula mucida]|nr:fungal-specific transcription factor domain-containing protein [Mucidula mucida]